MHQQRFSFGASAVVSWLVVLVPIVLHARQLNCSISGHSHIPLRTTSHRYTQDIQAYKLAIP